MKHKKLVTIFMVGFLFAGLTTIVVLPAKAAMDHAEMHPAPKQSLDVSSLEKIYMKRLDAISKNIEKAINLLEADKKEAALAELKIIINLTKNAASDSNNNTAEFANIKCPIMGGKINAETVNESLVREFEGKKIVFCCGGCPAQWDNLTDAQKRQKLIEAPYKKTEQTHSYRCS